MKYVIVVLAFCAAVSAGTKKEAVSDPKTTIDVVSVECDTMVLLKCKTVKMIRTMRDTTVVIKEEKVETVSVDTVKAAGSTAPSPKKK